jgi:membrane protein DedA with SNARE-associated domain
VSYWLGAKFKYQIGKLWPLSKYPKLLPMGRLFFRRYGWLAIVIGRFSGPLRASVPLVAGIVQMPQLVFQLANFGSAFLWAFVLLSPGSLLGRWLGWQ